jgi:hypothetical protein
VDVIFYLKNVKRFDKFKEMQLNPTHNLSLDFIELKNIYNLLTVSGDNHL